MIEPFQATFAVPLTCESCIRDISKPLYEIDGIKRVEADLKEQLVLVEGTAAPSAIVTTIQSTGRDAILRGSGKTNKTHAQVSNPIRGLVRMVQVSNELTLVDLTINGLSSGRYWATVRDKGDISRGPTSTGGIWEAQQPKSPGFEEPRGVFGTVDVDEKGRGNVFLGCPAAVWELIGRSIVVSKDKEGPFQEDDQNTLVGVIARSAGVWDNNKMVCSCSGKTVWEERKEQVAKGMA
ncbi:copper chaperone [Emydomyces testavorans]|uniref:Superoxide dismutase 1 copper chaperone n=1 Tax=Emydomyces testavorans TaxID=2070801 RepID=A0AAF0DJG4_9EURO|nr:copper chaperone [Emydomyces testavorans]